MEFNFAKVTNSRLMGTMGLIISWNDKSDRIVQYFLLDAEGLGLADYVSLKNPTKDEVYREEERLMGGLGSDRIRLSKEEALFLVKYFGNKNYYYEKDLPGEVNEYIDIIDKDLNIMQNGTDIEVVLSLDIIANIEDISQMSIIDKIEDMALDLSDLDSINLYIVKPGDSLWKIAKKYKTSIEKIVKINNIENPDEIDVGQKILIIR